MRTATTTAPPTRTTAGTTPRTITNAATGTATAAAAATLRARFAIPIMFANMLHSLNTSVNAFWVGRYLGEAALTATSISNSVLFLVLGGVYGFSIAST